ncbi:hypothetical protein [Leptospira santarosai]|uniref:hypothetical protein n=1 Tax=Leptospira santarosai TaxID=28183 RepID=UPI0024AF932D|nr:hypothetical protein [Leptospira santarosai]MDI7166627.1 hypothetical protein [Leptospira santarosai]
MRKSFTVQDLELARINNHFTIPLNGGNGNSEIILNDKEKIFVILEVRALGAWTIDYLNNSAKDEIQEYTRNGNGNEQFTVPFAVEKATLTGISEVSGFFIPVFT